MARKNGAALLMVLILGAGTLAAASDFYEWTDDQGVTHFADSLSEVPAKYRSQVKAPASEPKPKAAAAQAATPAAAKEDAGVLAATGLRKFEVAYQNEGSARRVIIPVKYNDSVTAPMALDTGSPGMVVSIELAERLGIFSKDSGTLIVTTGGIGGSTPAILTLIDSASVEGARDTFIPTTVMESISPAFEGLIGMDFLAGYTVSIDTKKQVVVFQENPPDPNARGGHDEAWWRRTFKEFRDMRDGWRNYAQSLERTDRFQKAKTLAQFQTQEAERLLVRLNQRASDHAVPQHRR